MFHSDIEQELKIKRFHILDKTRAEIPGNYPHSFPKFEKLDNILLGKSYVVRLFVMTIVNKYEKVDSGVIDVRINEKHGDLYTGIVETTLPAGFPLSKGDILMLKIEQVLYQQKFRK